MRSCPVPADGLVNPVILFRSPSSRITPVRPSALLQCCRRLVIPRTCDPLHFYSSVDCHDAYTGTMREVYSLLRPANPCLRRGISMPLPRHIQSIFRTAHGLCPFPVITDSTKADLAVYGHWAGSKPGCTFASLGQVGPSGLRPTEACPWVRGHVMMSTGSGGSQQKTQQRSRRLCCRADSTSSVQVCGDDDGPFALRVSVWVQVPVV